MLTRTCGALDCGHWTLVSVITSRRSQTQHWTELFVRDANNGAVVEGTIFPFAAHIYNDSSVVSLTLSSSLCVLTSHLTTFLPEQAQTRARKTWRITPYPGWLRTCNFPPFYPDGPQWTHVDRFYYDTVTYESLSSLCSIQDYDDPAQCIPSSAHRLGQK